MGQSFSAEGGEVFLWDSTHGMRSLRDVLVNDYGLDLAGWALERPTAISADGTTIVGNGRNPSGQFEAWVAVLSVPEPSTALLLVFGLAGLAAKRRLVG